MQPSFSIYIKGGARGNLEELSEIPGTTPDLFCHLISITTIAKLIIIIIIILMVVLRS